MGNGCEDALRNMSGSLYCIDTFTGDCVQLRARRSDKDPIHSPGSTGPIVAAIIGEFHERWAN